MHVPAHLSDEEAATLPVPVTAWNALVPSGQVQPGDSVLLLGTGGVSIFALQFAKLGGPDHHHLEQRRQAETRRRTGRGDGITTRRRPLGKAIRELVGDRGVDHVVEVGGAGTMPRSLTVRPGSHQPDRRAFRHAEFNPMPILMKNVCVQGIFVGTREMFEAMNRAISQHRLRPVIDRVFPFAEARAALSYMESGAHFGKIVIRA